MDAVDMGPSWMDPIVMYLTTEDLSSEKTTTRWVKYRATLYHLMNEVLYKKGFTIPYLQCIHPTQVIGILQEIYEGVCRSHIGGQALSKRALLQCRAIIGL